MITASALNSLAGLRHGFFTRRGGISEGVFASLNCAFGSGDSDANVEANRARAMEMMDQPAEALITASQVHSAKAVIVDQPWERGAAPEADALVTKKRGLALGILTADCMPVLLIDSRAKVICAAHAGWRGAKAGVVEAGIDAMVTLGARADRITAVMGPCIRQGSYEVGAELREEFLAESPRADSFFAPSRRPDHYLFDLPTYIYRRLDALGLKQVQMLQIDTVRESDRFFSHRRSTLLGEPGGGRNLSAIVLEG